MNAYVKSNFERMPDDHYPWEPCAPNGSGIADAWPGEVICGDEREDSMPRDCNAIVTNPPYDRSIIDDMVCEWTYRLDAMGPQVLALLLRTAWDHAKTRAHLFDPDTHYAGQVKMRFRPWWSEDRSKQPIHSYVWHIWDRRHRGEPVVRYWG